MDSFIGTSARHLAGEISAGRMKREVVWDAFETAAAKHEPTVKAICPFEDADARRKRFEAAKDGPLGGLPFGAKDIFNTAELPTEYNSPIYKGHQPATDCTSVALLRGAGGIVAGKTVTTEFAFFSPGPTTNPHNEGHTPGGSSSGSAAAVASGTLPFTLGTQTGGSVIRPGGFCGVVAYKPSFNLIPIMGVKTFAWSLDTIGVFAQNVDDAGFLTEAMTGRDLTPDMDAGKPRIGFCKTPMWPDATEPMVDAFHAVKERVAKAGYEVSDVELAPVFAQAQEKHTILNDREAAFALAHERLQHADQLSDILKSAFENGLSFSNDDYDDARQTMKVARLALTKVWNGVDVLIAPSNTGEAPETLASTGSSVFNRLWTAMGVPCVNLPCGKGPTGLPLGVQVIGPALADKETLSAAAMLAPIVGEGFEGLV